MILVICFCSSASDWINLDNEGSQDGLFNQLTDVANAMNEVENIFKDIHTDDLFDISQQSGPHFDYTPKLQVGYLPTTPLYAFPINLFHVVCMHCMHKFYALAIDVDQYVYIMYSTCACPC